MNKNISIIGAGIGGLTTAVILKQKNIDVTLYESAPAIQPVGAGIIMANNAMQIFKSIGIHKKIEAAGNKISSLAITDALLRPLSEVDLNSFESVYGVYNLSIHRADLQNILAEELGFENIKLSKRITTIENNGTYKLNFEDGTHTITDTIIGADGINSITRNQLFAPSKLRNAGQNCWRGVCEIDLPMPYHHQAVEAWGKGIRFGFSKMNNKQLYWFAVADDSIPCTTESLPTTFQSFHHLIIDLLKATDINAIYQNSLQDLDPIPTWHNGNACLVGDAAHATTPNLGQGACQAIEDAYVLGQLFETENDIAQLFKTYEQRRKKKALSIVNTSWQLGKIAHWQNPIAVALRNTAVKLTPQNINKKQIEKIFKID